MGANSHQTHDAAILEIEDRRVIKLQDELADGVVVDHTITAGVDDIDFQLVARNPTARASEAQWAQPCLRVDRFTGMPTTDARALQPQYIKQCFLFIDGQLTRLPTRPWADTARYTPGQVYVPKHVDRNNANPRPVSALVPSSGLCGCFSADEKSILAVAWEPYQEIPRGYHLPAQRFAHWRSGTRRGEEGSREAVHRPEGRGTVGGKV